MPAVSLRPLGVAELLDSAARLVRDNIRASFTITLPVAAVQTVLVSLVAYSVLGSVTEASPGGPATSGGRLAVPELLLDLFVGSLAAVLLSGLLAPLYVESAMGRRLTAAQTMRRLGRSWLPLVALTVIVAFGLEVGVVALVVGGVWLWGVWALAGPALAVERLGPLRALRRSFDLARVGFWRVWGVRTLAWLVTRVLGALITVPFIVLAAWLGAGNPLETGTVFGHPGVYVTVTALGSLLAGVVLAPFSAAVDAMLYLDARMRREGLDIVLMLEADQSELAPAPGGVGPAW